MRYTNILLAGRENNFHRSWSENLGKKEVYFYRDRLLTHQTPTHNILPYMTAVPPVNFEALLRTLKPPSILHTVDTVNVPLLRLSKGPIWSVSTAALRPEHVISHLQDLQCTPREDKPIGALACRRKRMAEKLQREHQEEMERRANKQRRLAVESGGGAVGIADDGLVKAAAPFIKGDYSLGHATAGRLYMPPWYAKLAFGSVAEGAFEEATTGAPMGPDVTFKGALRNDSQHPQQQLFGAYIEWLAHPGTTDCSACILSMPPGAGKTATFLYIASHVGRVTLVLMHTLVLVDQWAEQVGVFLPTASVGVIKEGMQSHVEDADVIVASMATLDSHIRAGVEVHPYLAVLWRRVGFVCVDEGHHIVARTFWNVVSSCPAQYRVVLTATPRRRDGLMDRLQWIAGPVVFQSAHTGGRQRHLLSFQFPAGDTKEILLPKTASLDGKPQANCTAMISALCENETWTEVGVRIASHLAISQGRRVVVITPRVDHVTKIAKAVQDTLTEAGVLPRKVVLELPKSMVEPQEKVLRQPRKRKAETEDDFSVRVTQHAAAQADLKTLVTAEVLAPLVGAVRAGTDAYERRLQFEGVVVVATPNILEEGVSYSPWDTLVNMNPCADPEQVVGRIMREFPGKRVPLVVDMWVNFSVFKGLFYKRRGVYLTKMHFKPVYHIVPEEDVYDAAKALDSVDGIDWDRYDAEDDPHRP